MATAAAVQPLPQWPVLQKQLEKKATFESAVSGCIAALCQPQPASSELRSLLARCMTLLRTRYSNPAFWTKARQLFQAAHDAVADEALRAELRANIGQCAEFLGEEAGPSMEATTAEQQLARRQQEQQRQRYLFEGQLGAAAEPAAAQGSSSLLGELGLGPLELAQLLNQQGGGVSGSEQEPPSQQVLEALQQELDAIAVEIMEETGQQAMPAAAPPASKKVARSLPREVLTPARLQELGGPDVRCPVCMDELHEGAEVQVMPCKHVFHPPCLAPWLEQHNSCPTCRHELPTDDAVYERRKEQEKILAEERRGADNALSHSEFLYI